MTKPINCWRWCWPAKVTVASTGASENWPVTNNTGTPGTDIRLVRVARASTGATGLPGVDGKRTMLLVVTVWSVTALGRVVGADGGILLGQPAGK